MNLINGMENFNFGFPIVFGISVVITILFVWWFRKKTWI